MVANKIRLVLNLTLRACAKVVETYVLLRLMKRRNSPARPNVERSADPDPS